MFTHRLRAALVICCALTACDATQSLDRLHEADPGGDAYQAALISGYRDYAQERADNYAWGLSTYFADKGLRAAAGDTVEPEDPALRKNIGLPEQAVLAEARALLLRAIATSSTTQPELTASAVLAYDRLLVLSEQGWDVDAIVAQRAVLGALMDKLTQAHVASPGAPPPPPPTIAAEIRRTVLYFPFDSDQLGDSARVALAELARSLPPAAGKTDIAINGHTDRVGSEDYNLRLSERRASFVLKALKDFDISAGRMQYFAFGESDPAVPTGDEVEEPKNRRVEIIVE